MKRFIPIILLVCIVILGTSVRFIGLGHNPVGIIDDEADAAYDAYSLLHTGKDQWGVSWPLTSFKGFGDYRLPAYTYFTIPSIAAFGLTPLAVRVPAAVFGTLTILIVYVLVTELFGSSSKMLPFLSAFFLAISPWHIGMSRIGLEETTSVFFVTLGMWMVLRGRSKPKSIIIGLIVLGLSLYVYTANIVLIPLLLGLTLYLFRKEYMRFRKYIFVGSVCFILLFTGFFISTHTSTAATRTRQVNLTNNPGLIDSINEKQGACGRVLPRILCRVVFNKYDAYGVKFLSNYFNHFSPNLLGIYGTDTQYSILPGRGLLYLFDYPLFVLALIVVFLSVTPARLMLVGWLFLSAIPDSLTSDGQYGRYFVSYPVWPILIAIGITAALAHTKYRRLSLSCIILLFLIAAGSFMVEYSTFFPFRYSQFSHFGYEDLVQKIEMNLHSYDRIIVSSRVNDAKQYIYYVFYTRYDPALFQSGRGIEKIAEQNGWVRVKKIGTVEFAPSIPTPLELSKDHALLIGAPSEFPKTVPKVIPSRTVPVEFTVKDKAGNILFEGVDSTKLYL